MPYTPIRIANAKKTDKIKCHQLKFLSTAGGNIKWYKQFGKRSGSFL